MPPPPRSAPNGLRWADLSPSGQRLGLGASQRFGLATEPAAEPTVPVELLLPAVPDLGATGPLAKLDQARPEVQRSCRRYLVAALLAALALLVAVGLAVALPRLGASARPAVGPCLVTSCVRGLPPPKGIGPL